MAVSIGAPVVYSTITFLAHNVNLKYYGGAHYLWCTPYFGIAPSPTNYTVPPTSSPFEIYRTLSREVSGSEMHSQKIDLNRVGIVRGAEIMRGREIITERQLIEIQEVARRAPNDMFRPLLCVIPTQLALSVLAEVDISKKANPLSHEYIAADLPRSVFDVISFGVIS